MSDPNGNPIKVGKPNVFICREPFPHEGPCEPSHFVHGDRRTCAADADTRAEEGK